MKGASSPRGGRLLAQAPAAVLLFGAPACGPLLLGPLPGAAHQPPQPADDHEEAQPEHPFARSVGQVEAAFTGLGKQIEGHHDGVSLGGCIR